LEEDVPDTALNNSPIEKARAIAPILRQEGGVNEASGRLSDKAVATLQEAGLFGLLVPRCYGGFEADPATALQTIEIVSEAEGSTGWVLMACNVGTGSAAGYLPRAGADAVFGKHIPIIAGEGGPRGRAERDGKGYRLTGRWSYGSGVLHTEYLHTGGMVWENGKPKESRTFIVPTKHAKFLGNWDTIGLKGTASIDYGLENVHVPEEFTHPPNDLVAQQGGSLYRLGIVGMSPLGHTGFTLGLGRRILDELLALAHQPQGRPSPLADPGSDQSFWESFAAAEAKYRAGRAFCYEVWQDATATLARDEPLSSRQFTLMRLALRHVTDAVAEVATFAYRSGGGVALRSGILNRCFRDMFGATQHRIVSAYMLRECGRELLGLAADQMWTSRGLVNNQ
jgi:alkylation response protein AidB-like acyl-CoA dehydrogenase